MITLEGLQLPNEMVWIDEFEWSKVKATTKRTIQGKFIVQEGQVPSDAGRSITLASDDAWIERDDVQTLQEMSNIPGRELLLTMHDGRTYLSRFRHWEESPFSAELLINTAYPNNETHYKLTLRLAVV